MRRLVLLLACLAPTLACKGSEPEQREPASKPSEASEPAAEPNPKTSPPGQPSEAAIALADALDPAAYEADLRFIAAIRPPGSPHWQAVQDRCAESLAASGFTVTRVSAEGAGTSVIGQKPGRDASLPVVVVGAHYDHIPDCAGADDNASGTAAVLAIARTLGPREWDRTLYVACWDEEETGLHGSANWADRAVADGLDIGLYMNFDAMGYADSTPHSQRLPPGSELLFGQQLKQLEAREYRGDFIAVLADDGARAACTSYVAHAERLGLLAAQLEIPGALKNSAPLAELRRSDHASFWKHEIPALFLSDTADYRTDTYHCGTRADSVETMDVGFAVKVTRAAAGTLAELL